MPVFKCTATFSLTTGTGGGNQAARTGSWSEGIYFEGSYLQAVNNFAKGSCWCSKRAALLPMQASIVEQRYQQVDPTLGATSSIAKIFPGNDGIDCDLPQVALVLSCPSEDRANVRTIEMRGIPDDVVKLGAYSPDKPFKLAMSNFKAFLSNFNFRGRVRSNPQAKIIEITANGVVATETALVVGIGDKVQILRSHNAVNGQLANGVFTVKNVDNQLLTISLQGWDQLVCRGGTVRKYQIIYPAIDGEITNVVRATTHKVGALFGAFRGRVSRR